MHRFAHALKPPTMVYVILLGGKKKPWPYWGVADAGIGDIDHKEVVDAP